MKIIGGGHEVPWPETLVVGNFVFPKDYRMNAFPRTPEGAMWYDIPDDEYLSWLADYLPDNLPELTPDQQQVYDNWDLISGFWIGDRGGWHELDRYAKNRLLHFEDCATAIDHLFQDALEKKGISAYDQFWDFTRKFNNL